VTPRCASGAAAPGLPLWRALRGGLSGALVALVLCVGAAAGSRAADLGPTELVKWSSASAGNARATAQTVPQAGTPTPVANARNVTVSWPATTLSGGTTSAGYIVRRYNTSNVLQTIGASCQGVITATSCTETNTPLGTWKYTVQPSHFSWLGTTSAFSPQVTVSNASLAFTSTTTLTTLPTTMSGTIAGFTAGTLTFRLDSTAGMTLTGTPPTVPIGGAGAITVTIPAGITDGPHSVFAIDSINTAASAVFTFVDPPVLQTLQMFDNDLNGKVETVKATFSRTLATYTAGTSPWTVANVPSAGTLSSVSAAGAIATLTFTEGPGTASTAVGSFTIALAQNSGGIRTVNGSLGSFAATAPTDNAAPALLTMVMQDTTANGKVDRVDLTFSETLAAYTAANAPWTLANVPSTGSLASVSTSAATATLTITEGAGAASTAVGSFTVALTSNAAGVRDGNANLTSFTARAPSDGAAPIRLTQGMYDVNLDGKVDRVVVTFSETLAAFSAPAGVWSLANAPSGASVSSVSVSGVTATVDLTQGTGAATTAVGSFTVALSANAAGIRDAAGNLSSYTAAAPTDLAAPAPIAMTMFDTDFDGKVQRVTVVFSETLLTPYGAGKTPWTLTNVPSNGTLGTPAVSGTTMTLPIAEGSGAADTTVGSFTIAMSAAANGVRDAALNLSSFTARAPSDGAGPVPILLADTNGTTDGLTQPGDTMSITFTEPLAAASVPSSTTVTLADPSGAGNDTLTITGVTNGAVKLGNNAYVTTDATSAAYASSTVVLSADRRTITVTVGATCAGSACGLLPTVTTSPTLKFVAATTLLDAAGNTAAGTRSQAIKLF
jgi:hypothetical protein